MLGEAESLVCEVYDRVRRTGFAQTLARRLEMLLLRPASVRGGREVRVVMRGFCRMVTRQEMQHVSLLLLL